MLQSPKKIFELVLLAFALFITLFVSDYIVNISLHTVIYTFVISLLTTTIIKSHQRFRDRFVVALFQSVILMLIMSFVFFSDWSARERIATIFLVIISFTLEYYILKRHEQLQIFRVIDEECISFEDIRRFKGRIESTARAIEKAGKVITPSVVKEIVTDLPRNGVSSYVTKDTLSDGFIENLDNSLDDPYIYIVLSDTGSAAGNVIGVFTNKPYNHASISFDRELKTLISYNGGEKISPPGLNPELMEYFFKKDDASIRVYRLAVTTEQKSKMIEKVKQINNEGSAYNLIGLAIRKASKPNIMFCSQFVYSLLVSVEANYFIKSHMEVKPTDLIELDYDRKLEFVEIIHLSEEIEVQTV